MTLLSTHHSSLSVSLIPPTYNNNKTSIVCKPELRSSIVLCLFMITVLKSEQKDYCATLH